MKSVILSNGNLNIGLNEYGLVSDLYFPDNGYNNHTLGDDIFHRIGVFIDGKMHWLNNGEWKFNFNYFSDALISRTQATNENLHLQIELCDSVSFSKDIFQRQLHIINLSGTTKNIKIFFCQNFSIDASKHLADTVQYLPHENAIIHYRGKRSFVIRGEKIARNELGQTHFEPFDQHTVGLFGIENKLGSFCDAEDGILSGSDIEHGQTDSVIGFSAEIDKDNSATINFSISCADSKNIALQNSRSVKRDGFSRELELTHKNWKEWLTPALKISKHLPKNLQKKFIDSTMLVKSHIAKSGAVIASNDSEMLRYARDDYSYCWPRDALYALWPLIRMGCRREAENFFEFCSGVVDPKGFLSQKFLPNGEPGPTWHAYRYENGEYFLPIQLDETAGVLFIFTQYYEKFKNSAVLDKYYDTLVAPFANFLVNFIDKNSKLPKSSFELWEMDFLSSTYTCAITYSALSYASKLAEEKNKPSDAYRWKTTANTIKDSADKSLWNGDRNFFYRGIYSDGSKSDVIDSSSFYGAFMFGLFDGSDKLASAFNTLKEVLSNNSLQGVSRFENDIYYLYEGEKYPNYWIITTLWAAEFMLSIGRIKEALSIIDWVSDRSSETGIFPEQLLPNNLEWRSVAPLTWSQAEFISACLDLFSAQSIEQ